jgi:hypothetical protein
MTPLPFPPRRKPSRWQLCRDWWMQLPEPMRVVLCICVVLLVLAVAGCATPQAPEGVQITVSEKRAAQCMKAGGCRLVSDAELADMQFQAYMLEQREALGPDAFDSHGCKRGAS